MAHLLIFMFKSHTIDFNFLTTYTIPFIQGSINNGTFFKRNGKFVGGL